MFKHTLLDSVNIFCKAIALYFFTISIIFIQDSVFFMIVSFFFFALLHRHRYTGMMSLIATLISIVAIFYPQLLWISKILILIVYVCLLTRFIHAPMIKYIFEKTFYRFQSRSFTTFIVTIIYFPGLLKKNWCKIDSVQKKLWIERKEELLYEFVKTSFQDFCIRIKRNCSSSQIAFI